MPCIKPSFRPRTDTTHSITITITPPVHSTPRHSDNFQSPSPIMSNLKFDFVQALKGAKGLGASWRLPEFKTLGQKPESEFRVLEDKHHNEEESVFEPDNREIIPPGDFADGGKYRCKLLQTSRPLTFRC